MYIINKKTKLCVLIVVIPIPVPITLLEFPRIPTLTGIQPCYFDHVYLILFHLRLQFVVLLYRLP